MKSNSPLVKENLQQVKGKYIQKKSSLKAAYW